MHRFALKLRLSVLVIFATTLAGVRAQSITAYQIVQGTAGNQEFGGALGMDFIVNEEITVEELGAFDSGSNGIQRSITVQLWSRNDGGSPNTPADDTGGAVLATASFTSGNDGTLVGGSRFKDLASPVTLPQGAYSIVAYGYGASEANYNLGGRPGAPEGLTTTDAPEITFVGTSRFGAVANMGSFPDNPDTGPANRYGAGTFTFTVGGGDSDGDGMPDDWEDANGLDKDDPGDAAGNPDGDGLTNLQEYMRMTDPHDLDSDDDGLHDEVETNTGEWSGAADTGTDPNNPDTDGDGLPDGDERHTGEWMGVTDTGTSPLDADSDGDGLSDGVENPEVEFVDATRPGTDPNSPDSDGDTHGDGIEVFGSSDPTDPASTPIIVVTSNAIVINEIHYDPADENVKSEFIELHNQGAVTVNLLGWRMSDGVEFTFPNVLISPGEYLVLAEDPPTIDAEFGVMALGPWTGKLSNEGERIVLRDSEDMKIDEVDYGVGFPWPIATQGEGPSMELIHPSIDNDLGGAWRSAALGFTGPELAFIPPGATDWSYRHGRTQPVDDSSGRQWFEIGYDESDDGEWTTGGAPIGYGDSDDVTELDDMMSNYISAFLRYEFTIAPGGAIPTSLLLRVYVDDGCVVHINGQEVERFSLSGGPIPFPPPDGFASNHEAAWEERLLAGASAYLVEGTNTLSIQVINAMIGSSDLSIDAELRTPPPGSELGVPSPGAQNSVFALNAPPQIRQVDHAPVAPTSGEDVVVTAKISDPHAVASATLHYQLVEPGSYIRLTDPAFETDWIDVAMRDDGTDGDVVAGDAVFTAVLPGTLQVHRRLVRYRITAADGAGIGVRVPYADDASANFAYFTYDGAPAWQGALVPGQTPTLTFDETMMNSLPIYHLIAREEDVLASQYNGAFNDKVYRFEGALVYDGEVYDHMHYRIRGHGSTYNTGKNKWKLRFNRGRYFQGRDDYGRKYREKVRTLNWSAMASPWNPANRGAAGLDEAFVSRLWGMAGSLTHNTNYFHLRIIDAAEEQNPSNQFEGDNWGLYMTIEQADRRFLDERGLPDGNVFNMHFGSSNIINQAAGQPSDRSDLFAFTSGSGYNRSNPIQPVSWWEDNVELDRYFAYRAVVEAVNHSDLRDQENSNYYHNPVTGKWTMIPWDCDLLYEEFDRWGPNAVQSPATLEQFRKCLGHPELNLRFQNRARELQDLLLNDDQGWTLIDEFANLLASAGGSVGWAELDAARWNRDPRSRKVEGTAGNGLLFFMNPYNSTRFPQHSRTLVSSDFSGMVQWVKDFIVPSGFGGGRLAAMAADASVPQTPTISYAGAGGFPTNGLAFQSSGFAPGTGGAPFAAIEWRLGEIRNPTTPDYLPGDRWVYEVDTFWTSGERSTFESEFAVPTIAVREGRTYRARVRHKAADGRWSRWSAPLEFVASAPDISEYRDSLVISEIMYNPSGGGDLEFVEIMNIGMATLDLSEVRFTKGIDFDFAGANITFIDAGEIVLVVRNLAAFEAEYGAGLPVAGEYQFSTSNNLSNGGEQLKLSFGAGSPIRDFVYDDDLPWPTAPDGDGSSLVLIRPGLNPDHADPANWRPSVLAHGSPGVLDGVSYKGGNLVDYAVSAGPAVNFSGGTPTLTYERVLGADDAEIVAEWSADLVNWTTDGMVFASEVPDGAGISEVSWQLPISEEGFVRLRIVAR